MGKIINFPTAQNWLDSASNCIDDDTPILIAYKMQSGEVCTGWWKASLQERQELISHLQIDVMMGVVSENVERLIE